MDALPDQTSRRDGQGPPVPAGSPSDHQDSG